MIVGVLVEISNKSVDRIFDYKVPEELENFKSTQKELEDYLTFLKQKYNK